MLFRSDDEEDEEDEEGEEGEEDDEDEDDEDDGKDQFDIDSEDSDLELYEKPKITKGILKNPIQPVQKYFILFYLFIFFSKMKMKHFINYFLPYYFYKGPQKNLQKLKK